MATINIGITGSNGFIGSHLKKYLAKKKIGFTEFSGSLQNKSDVRSFFKINTITQVIHLAGVFDPPFQNLLKKNCMATQLLLEIGSQYGLKKIIYSSSGAVYGEPIKKRSSEVDIPNPNTLYGLSKLLTEEVICYYQKYNISSVILRFPSVFGEGNTKGVIYKFLQGIKRDKAIIIEGDGNQRRNFLHVSDACEAIEKALFYKKIDIFNIAPQKDYSLLDIVNVLSKRHTFSVAYKKGDNNLRNLILDTRKAKKLLTFSAREDILDFLNRYSIIA